MQAVRSDLRRLLGAAWLFPGVILAAGVLPACACTSILVTRGASADGSVMLTYSCDDAGLYASLRLLPALPGRLPDGSIDRPLSDGCDQVHLLPDH